MKHSTGNALRNGVALNLQNLLIISHVAHYVHEGRLYAYGPYAREIDVWADLFENVVIAAPSKNRTPPTDCLPFSRANISIRPQRESGGERVAAKIRQLLILPLIICDLMRAMRVANAIHVRCPGNLGLLGLVLSPLFSRHLVAKYAGQWNGYPGEGWTIRLQRRLLKSRWWRGPVTVYGQWPDQPSHVIPFFTSILTEEQMNRARDASAERRFENPLRVIYVGRLSSAKNVDVLLRALATLKSQSIDLECSIIGIGPERSTLERLTGELNLKDRVTFVGGLDFENVLDYYEKSDVLVLASESEGWPKAIVEAMAFGLICIGSDRGLVPQMLGEGRGVVIEPRDVEALTESLRCIAERPADYELMSRRASNWAHNYTLQGLRRALGELLAEHWGASIDSSLRPNTPGTGALPL